MAFEQRRAWTRLRFHEHIAEQFVLRLHFARAAPERGSAVRILPRGDRKEDVATVSARHLSGGMRRAAPITNAVFRRHWPFALVVAAAALVRIGVAVAYRPALFYSDSWAYIDRTWCCGGVAFTSYPPSGYPVLMQLLSPVGRQLAVITSAQHVAGLLVGVSLYALLLRAGVNRIVAALAAAVVLLDAYSIALEQHIMSEPFFTLALTASVYFATDPQRRARAIAASGLLLGAAVTMRAAALFAIPVWLAYVLWTYRRPRLLATAAVCFALPLCAYAVTSAVEGYPFHPVRSFALSGGSTGWALYGRVGSIADCNEAHIPRATRSLCQPAAKRHHSSSYYQWDPNSPARRLFGWPSSTRSTRSDDLLKEFAIAIILAHPGAYVESVSRDFLRYFETGGGAVDEALTLPRDVPYLFSDNGVRDSIFPGLQLGVHQPAVLARAYARHVHTPRPLLGLLLLAGLVALGLAAFRRRSGVVPHRQEIFLLIGVSLSLLVSAVMTVELQVRYLLPTIPLLVGGGAFALADLSTFLLPALRSARGRALNPPET
jgi:Dolichyl-phosphate-mannose-protein mannosyltransferase